MPAVMCKNIFRSFAMSESQGVKKQLSRNDSCGMPDVNDKLWTTDFERYRTAWFRLLVFYFCSLVSALLSSMLLVLLR
jgi:hypothetical protein